MIENTSQSLDRLEYGMAEKSEYMVQLVKKMEIDRMQSDTDNGSSAFLKAYL